jgi:hypothetical protein
LLSNNLTVIGNILSEFEEFVITEVGLKEGIDASASKATLGEQSVKRANGREATAFQTSKGNHRRWIEVHLLGIESAALDFSDEDLKGMSEENRRVRAKSVMAMGDAFKTFFGGVERERHQFLSSARAFV